VLFLVLYIEIRSVADVVITFGTIHDIGPTLDMLLDLFNAGLAGFLGVILGSRVLDAIMKDYPARGIGVAFIISLVAPYFLHFTFLPQQTDFTVYRSLVQSAAACVTTWFVFRLPPLSRKNWWEELRPDS
jgi:uncharacterized membrane protein